MTAPEGGSIALARSHKDGKLDLKEKSLFRGLYPRDIARLIEIARTMKEAA